MTDTHGKLGYGPVLLVGLVARRRQALPVAPRQRVDGDALQEGAEQDGERDDRFREPRCRHALSDHYPRVEDRGNAARAEPTDKRRGLRPQTRSHQTHGDRRHAHDAEARHGVQSHPVVPVAGASGTRTPRQ